MNTETPPVSYEEIDNIVKHLLSKTKVRPKIGIICGSGLGSLADRVEGADIFPYSDIPGFPVSTVHGHAGNLIFGNLSGKPVVLMKGRFHSYEGYHISKVAMPVRVMKLLGVEILFVTNASGGLNFDYNVGDVMIIKDHLNIPGLAGVNPLIGPNDERFGPRFPPMSEAYDKDLRKMAKATADEMGYSDFIKEGVYCLLAGPSYETVTECKYIRLVGADALGMSTVPEVIVARHCGMKVFGLSLITNKCIQEYDSSVFANHAEVIEVANQRSKDLQNLVSAMVAKIEL